MRVPASPPKLGLIVVDYLTLIPWRRRQTTDRVGDVAQRLKVLAKVGLCRYRTVADVA